MAAIVSPFSGWRRPLTARCHQELKDTLPGNPASATKKMATLVCAPFSKWRHTPNSRAAILKMAVVCRHFENGDKIFATAGAPLTEPRRGDFLCAISQMAAFFVADAGFPGKVVFQFLVTTCREGTSPPRKWRHDCCHFSNGGFWVRHQCLGVISPPRQKWRRRKSAN